MCVYVNSNCVYIHLPLALWLLSQLLEVPHGLLHSFSKQTDLNATCCLTANGDVKENLRNKDTFIKNTFWIFKREQKQQPRSWFMCLCIPSDAGTHNIVVIVCMWLFVLTLSVTLGPLLSSATTMPAVMAIRHKARENFIFIPTFLFPQNGYTSTQFRR